MCSGYFGHPKGKVRLYLKFGFMSPHSFLSRLIPGVKKTTTSLPDIIKPMNGQRIRGSNRIIVSVSNHLLDVMHIVLGVFCPLSRRPDQVAEKVAARISENFSEAAIVMVGRKTSVFGGHLPLRPPFIFLLSFSGG